MHLLPEPPRLALPLDEGITAGRPLCGSRSIAFSADILCSVVMENPRSTCCNLLQQNARHGHLRNNSNNNRNHSKSACGEAR